MTVDRGLTPDREVVAAGGEELTGRPDPVAQTGGREDLVRRVDPVSRATVVWYSAVAAILFSWFLFGWLVLKQGFIDSVGESLGTGFALLLAVSVVGTVRRSRSSHPGGAVDRTPRDG